MWHHFRGTVTFSNWSIQMEVAAIFIFETDTSDQLIAIGDKVISDQ